MNSDSGPVDAGAVLDEEYAVHSASQDHLRDDDHSNSRQQYSDHGTMDSGNSSDPQQGTDE